MNRLQIKNHEIIAKHVWAKLSIRMLLIGHFLPESQSEITWTSIGGLPSPPLKTYVLTFEQI